MPRSLSQCPACDEPLEPVRLVCTGCGLQIEGKLSISRLALLSPEQQRFVEIFLLVRGNIKEAEKELGVSYPTIRKKLDEVVRVLGYSTSAEREHQNDVLDAIERKTRPSRPVPQRLDTSSYWRLPRWGDVLCNGRAEWLSATKATAVRRGDVTIESG